MNTDELIDNFVNKLSSNYFKELDDNEVPPYLRVAAMNEYEYQGKILKKDCTAWIDVLQSKLPFKLPPSYYSLVSRYAFPQFEYGSILLFANTGESVFYELAERVFSDKYLYPTLFANGLIEFGKAGHCAYDPICFDRKLGKMECPIVQIDHEEVLINERIKVIKEIAPSFIEFINIT